MEADELSRATVFELLSNERRIRLVEFVDERGATTIREAADHIAALENGSEDFVGSAAGQAVYIALYQDHLPKLDRKGVVKWDKRSGEIHPGPRLGELLDILAAL